MPVTELLLAGTELMVLGMGIVFSFLTLLVFALYGMSAIARRLEDRLDYVEPSSGPPLQADAPAEVAAVVAAVQRYRARRLAGQDLETKQ